MPSVPNTHQSFTIRVPVALYVQVAQMAQDEGVNLNKKINQLIKLGLGESINLNDALRALLQKMTSEDTVRE